MPNLQDIPFTSLVSRENDNRIPFHFALKADDCFTDTDAVVGRNGYRNAVAGTVVGTGTPQHIGRFRPAFLSARTVIVIGGEVFVIKDPSSETLSDGEVTNLGTPSGWGASATISGAALGHSYYLATDEAGQSWARIVWTAPDTYTLEGLLSIAQGSKPLALTNSALNWTPFSGLAAPTVSGCVVQDNTKVGLGGMNASWRAFVKTDNTGDNPSPGASAIYDLGADFDATGCDWVAITISPWDVAGQPADQARVTIQVSKDGTNYSTLGAMASWYPPVHGSGNAIFLDLRNVDVSIRAAIRHIKFLREGTVDGKWMVFGYMFLPTVPTPPNPPVYSVDFFDPASGTASALTDPLTVTVLQALLSSYPDCRLENNVPTSSGGSDSLMDESNLRVYNRIAGTPMPALKDIGAFITIVGTGPVFSGPATLVVRVWQEAENGLRLVNQAGVDAATDTVTSGGSYSVNVTAGDRILTNTKYRAGGAAPLAVAIASRAQRIVALSAVYPQRVYISNYVPTSDKTNPYPQFPDIALEDADGWSFDLAPTTSEIGIALQASGDAVYIGLSESWHFMVDLTPNSLPYHVFRRGPLGLHAVLFAEDTMFLAAFDGIYAGRGRATPIELTAPIRRIYLNWLAPNEHAVLAYDIPGRALFAFQGKKYLRFRFPDGDRPAKWTRGTLSHTVTAAATWVGQVIDPPA